MRNGVFPSLHLESERDTLMTQNVSTTARRVERLFPRWVPGMWLAAVVVGLPSLFIPSLATRLGFLGPVAVGGGLAGAGYLLWSSGATLAGARTSAAPGLVAQGADIRSYALTARGES